MLNRSPTTGPPPPEVPATLSWRRPEDGRPVRPVPCHPLLIMAEEAEPLPGRRALLPKPRHIFRPAPARGREPGRAPSLRADHLIGRRGRLDPLVVLVAGGKGGCGRSTLALDVAWCLARTRAPDRVRVLLVDADPVDPDLDLRVAASGQPPASAHLDQLLLRLPELADGTVGLDPLLWTHPRLDLFGLFRPEPGSQAEAFGPEHLDYLYRYQLRTHFDALVVDVGVLALPLGPAPRFWLGVADSVLIPLRLTAAEVRATGRTLGVLHEVAGLGRERCRGVVMGAGGLSRVPLELTGLSLWPRRWLPKQAAAALGRGLAPAELDSALAQQVDQLMADVLMTASPHRGRRD